MSELFEAEGEDAPVVFAFIRGYDHSR